MSSFQHQSTLLQAWLDLLCQMLPDVSQGVVFEARPGAAINSVAHWPLNQTPSAALLESARQALANNAVHRATADDSTLLLASPLPAEGNRQAVVALCVQNQSNRQALITQLLEWGLSWLRLLLAQQRNASPSSLDEVTRVLAEALRMESMQGAVTAVATTIARRLSSLRVTLGVLEGGTFAVLGTSFSSTLNRNSALVSLIEQGMMVAVDRGAAVFAHRGDNDMPVEWQALLAETDTRSVVAVPLLDSDQQIYGALLIESADDQPLPGEAQHAFGAIVNLLGPLLHLKWQQQLPLRKQLLQAIGRYRHAGLTRGRLIAATALALLLALWVIPGEYRVTAKAQLEGRVQRSVVAPFDGYVEQSLARAGASIKAGDLLARIDDDSLQLERQRWLNERDKYRKEYRKEFAALNHSETRILKAQMAQAEARLQLLEDKLQRVNIVAPIDGVIISGDLSRSLGAPVEKGAVLFEVAPLDEYRLILLIEERDIPHIQKGQTGRLTLTAQPGRELSFVVEEVATLFEQQEGVVRYRTEARLEDEHSTLRPGMGGVGKVSIGQRSLGWIAFHEWFDWLKLWMWSWLP